MRLFGFELFGKRSDGPFPQERDVFVAPKRTPEEEAAAFKAADEACAKARAEADAAAKARPQKLSDARTEARTSFGRKVRSLEHRVEGTEQMIATLLAAYFGPSRKSRRRAKMLLRQIVGR